MGKRHTERFKTLARDIQCAIARYGRTVDLGDPMDPAFVIISNLSGLREQAESLERGEGIAYRV